MKYLKTYETIFYNNISFNDIPSELIKFLNFFKKFIKKNISKKDSDKIYLEKSDNINNKNIYSIILDIWNLYIVFQFDFFKDNSNILKVKYLYDSKYDKELNMIPFNDFFDLISESKVENVWTIKIEKFIKNINNINIFFDLNKYNL